MLERVDDYVTYLSAQHGASGETTARYRADLGEFARFADGRGADDFDGRLATDYVAALRAHPYERTDIDRKTRAVWSFATFLMEHPATVDR